MRLRRRPQLTFQSSPATFRPVSYEQAAKHNQQGIDEQLSESNHSEDVESQEKKQAKFPGTVRELTCH
jgi:hypothetical protein